MARRPGTTVASTPARWLVAVLVAVVAVVTIVLAVLAVERTQPTEPADRPEPVPTFTFTGRSPSPSPTPTASPEPATGPADAGPGGAERFLSIGASAMWRGTAGDCDAAAPSIERSADGGATWTDVTPSYRGIGRLVSLDAFAGTEAEIVASMGDGCETQALRTFTQGQFWQPYPDVLAAARYVDPADRATVVTPGGRVAAPCASPHGLRTRDATVALVCDGAAYELVDGAWSPLAESGVLALAPSADGMLVASAASGCPGVAVTRVVGRESRPLACVAEADPSAPLAIAADGDDVRLWSGDALLSVR